MKYSKNTDQDKLNYSKAMIFHTLMTAQVKWSQDTFGGRSYKVDLEKLIHEAKEAQESGDPEEFADCLLCLLTAAGNAGISPEQLLTEAWLKMEKNKTRKWEKNPDGTWSHVKPETEVKLF